MAEEHIYIIQCSKNPIYNLFIEKEQVCALVRKLRAIFILNKPQY